MQRVRSRPVRIQAVVRAICGSGLKMNLQSCIYRRSWNGIVDCQGMLGQRYLRYLVRLNNSLTRGCEDWALRSGGLGQSHIG